MATVDVSGARTLSAVLPVNVDPVMSTAPATMNIAPACTGEPRTEPPHGSQTPSTERPSRGATACHDRPPQRRPLFAIAATGMEAVEATAALVVVAAAAPEAAHRRAFPSIETVTTTRARAANNKGDGASCTIPLCSS